MSLPSVTLVEQDGNIGVLQPGTRALALMGPAPSGTLNTPIGYARSKDVVSAYTAGRMVHAACYCIENYGIPVILCRTGETTVATEDTIDVTGKTGTSTVTYDTDTQAYDDYDLQLIVVNGGTIGAAGITFQWSIDGGNTLSAITALPATTPAVFDFPGTGGVGFSCAAGTLVAGDVIKGRTHAPKPNGTDIAAGIAGYQATATAWDLLYPTFDIDATLFDAIETGFGSSKMKRRAWIGSARLPLLAESEATYLSALTTIFSAKATTHGVLCAGAADITSGADFRKYRRPVSDAIAALAASVSEEIDLADTNIGSLPGVSIRDANGNVKYHDEQVNPGLDDARFCVLRTIDDGPQGVYPNNPRLFSASGSDFEFLQHRRVMNLAESALYAYLVRRLSKPVFVSRKTGRILPSQAEEIEAGAHAAISAVLDAKPKASGPALDGGRKYVKVSRLDNLLSTKTLTGQAGIVPLAYPKNLQFEIGFRNPINTVRAV